MSLQAIRDNKEVLMVGINLLLLVVAVQMNGIAYQQTQIMDEQRNISETLANIEKQKLEYSEPSLICQHVLQEKDGRQTIKVFVSNTGSYPTLIRNITGFPMYNYEYSDNKYIEDIATVGEFTFEPPNRIVGSGEQRVFNYTSENDVNMTLKLKTSKELEVKNRSILRINNLRIITDQSIVKCRKGL